MENNIIPYTEQEVNDKINHYKEIGKTNIEKFINSLPPNHFENIKPRKYDKNGGYWNKTINDEYFYVLEYTSKLK